MLKVLLVDDEIQVRKGLRLKMRWEEEGFQIAGEASNGVEALEKLRNIEIDVVITDMRMPLMDGLELAKRCQLEFQNVKVVVLSGYSDFEYVRGSLKEGVKDYLLKPVAPDELVDVLSKIRKEVEKEKRNDAESARLRRLVQSQLQEVQEQYLLYLVKEEWLELSIVLERLHQLQLGDLINENAEVQFVSVEIRENEGNPNRLKELWLPFQVLCKEIAKEHYKTFSFYDPSYANMIHFLLLLDPLKKNVPMNLILKIQQAVKQFLKLQTVVGIGNVIRGIEHYKIGFISSLLAWSQSQLGSRSQVIDGSDVKEEEYEFSPDIERKLTNGIESANFERFKENIHLILGNGNRSVWSFTFSANRVLFLLGSLAKKYNIDQNNYQKLMWNCQQSIWELNSSSKVIDQLLQLARLIIDKVQEARFSNGKLIVASVQQYLDQHYASEISLSNLSELFHINKAHLSEIFKNYVGQNFSDYLIQLRLEKAKQFLKDKELKIIDVSNLTGFSNSGYFSTVFKKHFGQTPVEFRNSME